MGAGVEDRESVDAIASKVGARARRRWLGGGARTESAAYVICTCVRHTPSRPTAKMTHDSVGKGDSVLFVTMSRET